MNGIRARDIEENKAWNIGMGKFIEKGSERFSGVMFSLMPCLPNDF